MVADDDGQEVVEVVGDTAGELAERVHALCLPERLRLLHLLCDVADELHEAKDIAARIADNRGDDLARESLAVLTTKVHQERIGRANGARCIEPTPDSAHARVVVFACKDDVGVFADQLFGRIAEDPRDGGIDEEDAVALVGDEDGLWRIIDDRLEQRLLPGARRLGLPLSGQVVDDSGKMTLAVNLVLADREMHREGCAVFAPARDLAADVDDLVLARLTILTNIAVVLALVGLGHEHPDILPDQFGSGVAEQPFGRGVDALDDAGRVDRDDRIGGRPQHFCKVVQGGLRRGFLETVRTHDDPALTPILVPTVRISRQGGPWPPVAQDHRTLSYGTAQCCSSRGRQQPSPLTTLISHIRMGTLRDKTGPTTPRGPAFPRPVLRNLSTLESSSPSA